METDGLAVGEGLSLTMDFAKQMRIMREVRGLLQRELTEMTGITTTHLSFIESGRMLPTAQTEAAIKRALRWPARAEEAFGILEGEEAA